MRYAKQTFCGTYLVVKGTGLTEVEAFYRLEWKPLLDDILNSSSNFSIIKVKHPFLYEGHLRMW